MEPWFAHAKPIDSLEAEIGFCLQDAFQPVPGQPPEPLALPEFPRASRLWVRTSEAIGHEAELAAYYARVMQLAHKHGLRFGQVSHHFWMRLWLWNSEQDIGIPFPWYDTLSEIEPVLTALSTLPPGQRFHDIDQVWEIELGTSDTLIYIRHGNPEGDGEPGAHEAAQTVVALPQAALAGQLISLIARTDGLVAHLADALGCDVWSAPLRPEAAMPAARI